jgi:hypothetical protein
MPTTEVFAHFSGSNLGFLGALKWQDPAFREGAFFSCAFSRLNGDLRVKNGSFGPLPLRTQTCMVTSAA